MRLSIDTDAMTLEVGSDDSSTGLDLYSPDAFAILRDLWVKVGWHLKYSYLFTWMGRPIIQLPEDILVIQELIYRLQPDVIIETGVAHGGSLVFYASLCELMGRGRVLGIDIEIREHNREAIESHALFKRITLIEGSSTDHIVVDRVARQIGSHDSVMVILDSNHEKGHVLEELDAYAPLVTEGSYIVVCDGVMELVHDVPRGSATWLNDNPKAAAADFLSAHPEFALDDPPRPIFDESLGVQRATHWPGAFLRRKA